MARRGVSRNDWSHRQRGGTALRPFTHPAQLREWTKKKKIPLGAPAIAAKIFETLPVRARARGVARRTREGLSLAVGGRAMRGKWIARHGVCDCRGRVTRLLARVLRS